MCMKATPEGCELRDELKETKTAVAALDTRLTKVEGDVALMRSETQEGIGHRHGSRIYGTICLVGITRNAPETTTGKEENHEHK